jgi:hypothetical protein
VIRFRGLVGRNALPVRNLGQVSPAEEWLRPDGRIGALVMWHQLEKLVVELRAARMGRPAVPPLALLKVLLWQSWHNLSGSRKC